MKGNSKMNRNKKWNTNFKEANKCRKGNDIKELDKPIKRKCLKCDKPFLSLGIWNRICETCNRDNKRYIDLNEYCGGVYLH